MRHFRRHLVRIEDYVILDDFVVRKRYERIHLSYPFYIYLIRHIRAEPYRIHVILLRIAGACHPMGIPYVQQAVGHFRSIFFRRHACSNLVFVLLVQADHFACQAVCHPHFSTAALKLLPERINRLFEPGVFLLKLCAACRRFPSCPYSGFPFLS